MTVWREKVALIFVGLPACGKSYIGHKILAFLRWRGILCKIFNVGNYRRKLLPEAQQSKHTFFAKNNRKQREMISFEVLDDMLDWLENDDSSVAIFDAVNGTRERRRKVLERCQAKSSELPVLFVESICDDPQILKANRLWKVQNSSDYRNMDKESALIDLRKRIEHYEKVYSYIADTRRTTRTTRITRTMTIIVTTTTTTTIITTATTTTTTTTTTPLTPTPPPPLPTTTTTTTTTTATTATTTTTTTTTTTITTAVANKKNSKDIKDLEEDYSYIKLMNLKNKVICNNVQGRIPTLIAIFLNSIHIEPRKIYLCRAGHSKDTNKFNYNGKGLRCLNRGHITPDFLPIKKYSRHFEMPAPFNINSSQNDSSQNDSSQNDSSKNESSQNDSTQNDSTQNDSAQNDSPARHLFQKHLTIPNINKIQHRLGNKGRKKNGKNRKQRKQWKQKQESFPLTKLASCPVLQRYSESLADDSSRFFEDDDNASSKDSQSFSRVGSFCLDLSDPIQIDQDDDSLIQGNDNLNDDNNNTNHCRISIPLWDGINSINSTRNPSPVNPMQCIPRHRTTSIEDKYFLPDSPNLDCKIYGNNVIGQAIEMLKLSSTDSADSHSEAERENGTYIDFSDQHTLFARRRKTNVGLSIEGAMFARHLHKFILDKISHSKSRCSKSKTLDLIVYTSTLPRAVQTVEEIVDVQSLASLVSQYDNLASLNQLNTGCCVGLTLEQIKTQMPNDFAAWERDTYRHRFPGGESQHDVTAALEPLVMEIEKETSPILIVSHLSTLQVLYGYFINCDVKEYAKLKISPHRVIELTASRYGWEEKQHDLSRHRNKKCPSTIVTHHNTYDYFE